MCIRVRVVQHSKLEIVFCFVLLFSCLLTLTVSSTLCLYQQRLAWKASLCLCIRQEMLYTTYLCFSAFSSPVSFSFCLSLSVSIIQWGKLSWCLLLHHPPSFCLSFCVASHLLPMSKIDLFPPTLFFLFFCVLSALSNLYLSVFYRCQKDIYVLWMWSRGDVWMFWSRTVCLTFWIQTETYWFTKGSEANLYGTHTQKCTHTQTHFFAKTTCPCSHSATNAPPKPPFQ